jgi:choline dehydrogenase
MSNYDYVIVGAGSSGSALAGRLAADNKIKILLLEAGPKDHNPYVKLPIGYGKLFYDQNVNWKFNTEPEKNLHGKRMYWPRGKVLGGSSSINAMVFARGSKNDFDEWGDHATGWHWQDVEPFFRKMETWRGTSSQGRGNSGPIQVTDVSQHAHTLTSCYLEATEQVGINKNPDYNTGDIEGSFVYQINTHKGIRSSASYAYLSPRKKNKNLVVITKAHVKKILFKGTKAVGVEYSYKGNTKVVNASKEVILSAGALASPQLLQVSGIGPARSLKDLNIEVISDLPDVGLHLKDHIGLDHTLLTKQPSLNQILRPT